MPLADRRATEFRKRTGRRAVAGALRSHPVRSGEPSTISPWKFGEGHRLPTQTGSPPPETRSAMIGGSLPAAFQTRVSSSCRRIRARFQSTDSPVRFNERVIQGARTRSGIATMSTSSRKAKTVSLKFGIGGSRCCSSWARQA